MSNINHVFIVMVLLSYFSKVLGTSLRGRRHGQSRDNKVFEIGGYQISKVWRSAQGGSAL